MDERDFYTERPESKTVEYTCPRCKRSNQYQVRWIRRTKKDRLPPRADERDRALYAKLKDYLVRSEEHTSELQSQSNLVCRLLLEKKKECPHITQCVRAAGQCVLVRSGE